MRGMLVSIALTSLLWLAGSCSDAQTSRNAPAIPVERGVTLEAEVHHAGLVVLRSSTFR